MISAPIDDWLPDFCRVPTLFVVMVAAQIIVLAAVLMPGASGDPATAGSRLFVASLFAQWLALLACVLLCKLRPVILRIRPRGLSILAGWILPTLTTLTGAAAVNQLDLTLGLDLTVPSGHGLQFALSCAAVAGLLAAALLRYFYVQQLWQAQVQASAQAEVRALQARIRPHFLFNSLNSIVSLVRRDPRTAERAIEDLSEVFRAALGAGQGDWTLGEELDLVDRYLAIERLRLGDRLRLRSEIDADCPRTQRLPRLLLQPLLENAVLHGVARLGQGGEVHLRVSCADGGIEVQVDNPCPEQPGQGAGNQHAQASIEQRLQHYFGPAAWMTVVPAPGYYSVTLWMPRTPDLTPPTPPN
ncbi:sensor histidine kinase [Aquimonas sp.]|jgi:two-component system sensor histidine kinase AlgZ|uniref:sensor histidine kinase n=1 Tax=Aquimonas sp. TaxID=1872588 RepID=UPI0037C18F5B